MKALIYGGPRDLHMEERPEPSPGANEVKLAPTYVGICGSDLHGYTGASGRRTAPMVMGHEIAAVVEETGPAVTRFKPGDRVTVQPILYCGACDFCKQGLTNVCANRRGLGVMDVDGAFCEHFCVPEANVFRLPDTVSDKAAAMLDPFSVAFRAAKYAMPIKGKNILIVGAGTIGLLFLKLARYYGADKLIVSDLSPARLDIALKLGADLAVNPKEREVGAFLKANGLADKIDVSAECVGAPATARQSIDHVRINGLAIWVGNAAEMVEINMQHIVTRSVRIQGTYGFTEADFTEALGFLAAGHVTIEDMVTGIVPLEEAPAAFASLCAGAGAAVKVLVKI